MTQISIQQAFEMALADFRAGRMQRAGEICGRILAAQPNHPDAMHMLGAIALQSGQPDVAADYFRKAISGYSSTSDLAEAYSNLGMALTAVNEFDASIAAHQKSLELRPLSAESNNNLGHALQMAGREEEADAAFHKAMEIRPDYPDALNNLGNLHHSRGEYARAIEVLERGIAADPQFAAAHVSLCAVLLLTGEGARGWRESEWRLKLSGLQRKGPHFVQPQWDGSPLNGRRILLHCEQGFGDSIHFCRYVPEVAARGGKVNFAGPAALVELFETLAGVDRLIRTGESLGDFDLHCPLPSLPLRLDLPDPYWTGAYLKSDLARVDKFADLTARAGGRLKVGLIWHGRAQPAGRSVPLSEFKPLAMEGVQLFGLQVGKGREEIQQVDFDVIDAGAHIENFADTAAIMQLMDLIVSIDTASAQLAGAMGLRAWIMLKKVPDWRWLLDRRVSPWYPGLRLFRQNQSGQWHEPIAAAAKELRSLIGSAQPGA